VDLKNERFDLAIRIADLKSADLIAAKLARNHRVVCGSPVYFKRAGKPKALADLTKHNCLVTSTEDGVADSWHFQDKGKPVSVKVAGNLQCNDGEVLTRWSISGEGLAWRSAWEVSEEVKRGRLITALDDYAFPGNNIYAVYPERRLLPAKVKFFIDFLKKTFGDPPYWE
jgi:DNA-binding transcriptional LysR family regulator